MVGWKEGYKMTVESIHSKARVAKGFFHNFWYSNALPFSVDNAVM